MAENKDKWKAEQRIQPFQPVSINSARSLPRIIISVLADLSSDDSFAHNLGPKCSSECPP